MVHHADAEDELDEEDDEEEEVGDVLVRGLGRVEEGGGHRRRYGHEKHGGGVGGGGEDLDEVMSFQSSSSTLSAPSSTLRSLGSWQRRSMSSSPAGDSGAHDDTHAYAAHEGAHGAHDDANEVVSGANEVISIALGSCSKTHRHQPAWDMLLRSRWKPHAFAWMGDIVYTDVKSKYGGEKRIRDEYAWQSSHDAYRRFVQEVGTVVGTWDDHDFWGNNAAGTEVPAEEVAVAHDAHVRFIGDPPSSVRWKRKGVYNARYLAYLRGDERRVVDLGDGEDGSVSSKVSNARVVQLLLMDTRTFLHRERHDPLGDEQWAWLERHLAEPADVRIVVSSIQVLSNTRRLVYPFPVETWAKWPKSRSRLLSLVGNSTGAAVLMSGDVHMAEIAALPPRCVPEMRGRVTVDFTSSGMTHTLREMLDRKLLFGIPPLKFLHRTLFPAHGGGVLHAFFPRHFGKKPRFDMRNVAHLSIDFTNDELVATSLSLEPEDSTDPAAITWKSSLRALTANNEVAAQHTATLPAHSDAHAPCFEDELSFLLRSQMHIIFFFYVCALLLSPVVTAWSIRRWWSRRGARRRTGKRE